MVTDKQTDRLLCEFLRGMIERGMDRDSIAVAIDSLNDAAYEMGLERSMDYDPRDGSARLVG